jgi:hypothetical protein
MDKDTYNMYFVGSYVYTFYKNKTGGLDITGDPDIFYLILGEHIKTSYPTIFSQIVNKI